VAVVALSLAACSGSAKAKSKDAVPFDKTMVGVADHALTIAETLSDDATKGVTAAATAMAKLAGTLDPKTAPAEHAAHYAALPAKLTAGAQALAAAKDIAAMREAFKAFARPLAMWAGMSGKDRYNVAYCSMARGSWLQRGKVILNPYHGKSMLHCGELVSGPDAPAPAGKAKAHGGH